MSLKRSVTHHGLGQAEILTKPVALAALAAFLDRVERADGEDDFRIKAFRQAVKELETSGERARMILMALSDPTTTPIPEAKGKSACGAWPGK